MSSEDTSFYEKEKDRLLKQISKTMEEIDLVFNNIVRSQEGTLPLARDKVSGEVNVWTHLREVGLAKARERAEEVASMTANTEELVSSLRGSSSQSQPNALNASNANASGAHAHAHADAINPLPT